MLSRRNLLVTAATALALCAGMSNLALAQDDYPTRPIKIVIANPPGGDDDTLTRFIAPTLSAELGQPVVVENRGGGASTLGAMAASQANPDGYTLLCLHTAGLVQTQLRSNLSYSLDSFEPIALIGGYPMALVVSAASNIDSVPNLKKVANTADGVTFASAGAGTLGHLTAVRFLKAIEGNGVHVAYKNNPDGLQALSGGFTQMMFPSAREGANLQKDGLLRVLAVTSPQRTVNLPDVPTMTELGYPSIDSQLWYSYAAPAGTPPEILEKLTSAITKAVETKEFKERFGPMAYQSDVRTGAELKKFWKSEADRWRQVIVENNVRFTD
ncbi:Bug family tripartite tricarboxylate transporter substrate binding protein [Rhizobium giardinii]|uniref:Bug family tripartite tricarboxylate transporter substrate binding protein n=1 Tax=Rhizobium giardinii TaxID=56731 RepID=UPI0039E190C2